MNFIKNQIQKFATFAIIIGVGVSCIGLWQIRNCDGWHCGFD